MILIFLVCIAAAICFISWTVKNDKTNEKWLNCGKLSTVAIIGFILVGISIFGPFGIISAGLTIFLLKGLGKLLNYKE